MTTTTTTTTTGEKILFSRLPLSVLNQRLGKTLRLSFCPSCRSAVIRSSATLPERDHRRFATCAHFPALFLFKFTKMFPAPLCRCFRHLPQRSRLFALEEGRSCRCRIRRRSQEVAPNSTFGAQNHHHSHGQTRSRHHRSHGQSLHSLAARRVLGSSPQNRARCLESHG